MNCAQCRDNMIAYVEGLLDESSSTAFEAHLAECADCRAEMDEIISLQQRLVQAGQSPPSASLEAKVMNTIVRRQSQEIRKMKMHIAYRMAGVGAAAAAAIILVFAGMTFFHTDTRAEAAEMLAKAADAASNVRSIHIKCRMRTLPRDNFDLVWLEHDFVDIEMWKQFGEPERWRIEKPGRVAVVTGQDALMLIKPRTAVKGKSSNPGFSDWLKTLLDVDQIITDELRATFATGSGLKIVHAKGKSGGDKVLVTVNAKAQGDYTNDYLKNKFVKTSDNRRVYRFDRDSKLLEAVQMYVKVDGEEVLAFEATEITYDEPIDPALFTLELPDNVEWYGQMEILPDNEKYEQMSPDQAARAFFEACGRKDWQEAQKFLPVSDMKGSYLGGAEVIAIGKPFQSGPFHEHWFVPYEIRLASGRIKKHNLCLKKDKRTKRLVVNGGF